LRPDKDKSAWIASVLKRRVRGEPIQYILGKTEFMGLEFKLTKDVLIPRPETEILVETVIKIASGSRPQASGCKIMDIGTGSGNIAISLAKILKNCKIVAIDISQEAINVARGNALLNGVVDKISFINQDFFSPQPFSFDFIVSNPPYIPTLEINTLQPEISYEPRIALDGGRDGLDFYRRIIAESPEYLKEGGYLIMEIGFGQKDRIKNIFQKSENFEIIEVVRDYSSIERVIVAKVRRDKP
jgi:release factor glutamine methyltransferase